MCNSEHPQWHTWIPSNSLHLSPIIQCRCLMRSSIFLRKCLPAAVPHLGFFCYLEAVTMDEERLISGVDEHSELYIPQFHHLMSWKPLPGKLYCRCEDWLCRWGLRKWITLLDFRINQKNRQLQFAIPTHFLFSALCSHWHAAPWRVTWHVYCDAQLRCGECVLHFSLQYAVWSVASLLQRND